MNLHKNPKEFNDTLLIIGNRLNISPAIIEKDYFVTLFLEKLSNNYLTASLNFLPAENAGTVLAAILIVAPV